MRKQPNTKMIGIFMLSGLAIFIGIILGYITNNYITNKKDMLVMYFEESIRGLNAGSSVVFNGVEIGKVEKIELIANSNNMSFRIPVYVTLSRGDYDTALLDKSFRSRKELLSKLIEKGLRARLGIQNYITGQLIIELVGGCGGGTYEALQACYVFVARPVPWHFVGFILFFHSYRGLLYTQR